MLELHPEIQGKSQPDTHVNMYSKFLEKTKHDIICNYHDKFVREAWLYLFHFNYADDDLFKDVTEEEVMRFEIPAQLI